MLEVAYTLRIELKASHSSFIAPSMSRWKFETSLGTVEQNKGNLKLKIKYLLLPKHA